MTVKRMFTASFALALLVLNPTGDVSAFQIGTLGPKLEARLTNEPDSSLLRAAGRLGKILKLPVHEEITKIGFDCPADLGNLGEDRACAGDDSEWAGSFVLYGVRWNDLPPFALAAGQGKGCKKFGFLDTPACRTDQTVRFSTQPDCWLCLFFDAEKTTLTKRISGCEKGANIVQGTLMTRSHFGDLQFLHAMADREDVPAKDTQAKLLDWAQFTWKIFDGEITPETTLKSVAIPTIQSHFGCTEWTVSDIFILGAKPALNKRIADIAFGSIAHTLQDSFAEGHAEREPAELNATCSPELSVPKPGAIVEFHAYGQQDGKKHDARDARDALVEGTSTRGGVIDAMRQMFSFYYDNANWSTVEPFFKCVFAISSGARDSSAGADYRRDPQR